MAVNWNLGVMPNIGGNALDAFRTGQQEVRQEKRDDEATALRREEIGVRRGEAEAKAAERKRDEVGMFAKLLDHAKDETTYRQALGAAKQYGLPVDQAPPNFDPAWIAEQKIIVRAFQDGDGEKISGIARELEDAGYQRGTPEFAQAMRGVINNKYASDYVDGEGNTRRRSALNLPGSQGGPQPGAIEDGYRFKGGNPADPNAWEAVGGPQVAPAGNFPG